MDNDMLSVLQAEMGTETPIAEPAVEPAAAATPTTAPVEPAVTTPEPPAAAQSNEFALMQQQVRTLSELVSKLQTPASTPAPAGASQAQPYQQYLPAGGVDPRYTAVLFGADVPMEQKHQFFEGLVKSINERAVAAAYQMLSDTVTNNLLPQVERMIAASNETAQTAADFYTRYPNLNRAELKPLVRQVAEELARARGTTTYSSEFGDLVAQTVNQRLTGLFNAFGGGASRPPSFITPPARAGVGPKKSYDPNSPEAIAATFS